MTRFHTPGWQGDRRMKVTRLTNNIQEERGERRGELDLKLQVLERAGG